MQNTPPSQSSSRQRVVVVITASIAAYKSVEFVRELVKTGKEVKCILTESAKQFVSAFTLQTLTGNTVYSDLFSLTDEQDMGHIALSRWADIIFVCPATAHIIAKLAHGLADDLASTLLLATLSDTPILIAPAMNVGMWHNPATQTNLDILAQRGFKIISPEEGEMACHEYGMGRLASVARLIAAVDTCSTSIFSTAPRPHVLVTAGPTYEPIDPIRFIGNYSSGRQGYEIARAFTEMGAKVTLISGPVHILPPAGVILHKVTTAEEMLSACLDALPADIAIMCAAVGDWRIDQPIAHKIKKTKNQPAPTLKLVCNPDILSILSHHEKQRPSLVVGFAAETQNLVHYAQEKLTAKGCDWIIANNVGGEDGVMGKSRTQIHIFTKSGNESLPEMSKAETAREIAGKALDALKKQTSLNIKDKTV